MPLTSARWPAARLVTSVMRRLNWFEPALKRNAAAQSDPITEDDAVLMFYRTVVVFDRVQRQTKVVSVVLTDEAGRSDVRLHELYETAVRETERIEKLLLAPAQATTHSPLLANNDPANAEDVRTENASSKDAHEVAKASVRSNWARADFESAVDTVKEHIFAGDCYQAVISQRFARSVTAESVRDLPRLAQKQSRSVHLFAEARATSQSSARRRRCWCVAAARRLTTGPSPARVRAARPRRKTTCWLKKCARMKRKSPST